MSELRRLNSGEKHDIVIMRKELRIRRKKKMSGKNNVIGFVFWEGKGMA